VPAVRLTNCGTLRVSTVCPGVNLPVAESIVSRLTCCRSDWRQPTRNWSRRGESLRKIFQSGTGSLSWPRKRTTRTNSETDNRVAGRVGHIYKSI